MSMRTGKRTVLGRLWTVPKHDLTSSLPSYPRHHCIAKHRSSPLRVHPSRAHALFFLPLSLRFFSATRLSHTQAHTSTERCELSHPSPHPPILLDVSCSYLALLVPTAAADAEESVTPLGVTSHASPWLRRPPFPSSSGRRCTTAPPPSSCSLGRRVTPSTPACRIVLHRLLAGSD